MASCTYSLFKFLIKSKEKYNKVNENKINYMVKNIEITSFNLLISLENKIKLEYYNILKIKNHKYKLFLVDIL